MYALTLLVYYTIGYTATISVIIAFNGIWVAWILYDARCVLRDNVAREVWHQAHLLIMIFIFVRDAAS